MKFMEYILDRNPIDELASRSFCLPETLKGVLAINFNPRPAGLVLRRTEPLKNQLPWRSISAQEWLAEIKHNSGNIICVLLRHPLTANDDTFLRLFDTAETEYKAAIARSKWAVLTNSDRETVDKVLMKLRPALEDLIAPFCSWSLHNREMVVAILDEILSDDVWWNGNARKDLERSGIKW